MNGMSQKYLTPKEASKLVNVTIRTLYNWDAEGKVETIRTKGGHRRFLTSSLLPNIEPENRKRRICYCRVSTLSQKEDLERQVEFFKGKYPDYEIVKDIGSGINWKRKGLNSLLDSAIEGNLQEVVVTHKDRLCRFGFELIERVIRKCSDGGIVVLNQKETSPQEELVNDLLSIITVFSSRLYGLRSHALKNKIKEEALKNSKDEAFSLKRGKGENPDDVGSISVVL